VPSTWYQGPPGTRYQVPGTRYQVPGTKYLVADTRYQVKSTWTWNRVTDLTGYEPGAVTIVKAATAHRKQTALGCEGCRRWWKTAVTAVGAAAARRKQVLLLKTTSGWGGVGWGGVR